MEPPLPREEPPLRPVNSAITSRGSIPCRQHVAVVTIAGDDLVALDLDRLHADRDGFLPDIEVTETADQSHAIELARALFKAAHQQHVAIELQKVFLAVGGLCDLNAFACSRHW